MTLILSRSELAKLLDMREVIAAVEAAHLALATGLATQPARTAFHVTGYDSLIVPMVAGLGPDGFAGVKLMTDTPSNSAAGRPVQQSMLLLTNLATGTPTAILDGAAITQVRTAAASAVATRHLANPEGGCLGLIGAGAQARSHLEAIRLVRPISRVVAWTRSRHTASQFVSFAQSLDVAVEILDSPEKVTTAADILCTLTPSKKPIIDGSWFTPGMHINAVGAPPRADHREIDDEGIRRSRVTVDSREVALAESGDVLIPSHHGVITKDHFRTELGDVIAGRENGRSDEQEITLYNSTGIAIQDIAAASLAVTKAQELGIGTEIDTAG